MAACCAHWRVYICSWMTKGLLGALAPGLQGLGTVICADTQLSLGLSQLSRGPCTPGVPAACEQERRAQGPPTRPEIPLTPEFQVQITRDLSDSKWKSTLSWFLFLFSFSLFPVLMYGMSWHDVKQQLIFIRGPMLF